MKRTTPLFVCSECNYKRRNMMDFWTHLQNKHNLSSERADDVIALQDVEAGN